MTRYLMTLRSDADREKAIAMINIAPVGTRIEIKHAKRTTSQNSKLWALLTEVSDQVRWNDMKLRPQDWKLLFIDALKRELRLVPNLDGTAFVSLGRSSSDLSKEEFSDLITIIHEFGARHGVVFGDDDD